MQSTFGPVLASPFVRCQARVNAEARKEKGAEGMRQHEKIGGRGAVGRGTRAKTQIQTQTLG
jgi:hypothetical protein